MEVSESGRTTWQSLEEMMWELGSLGDREERQNGRSLRRNSIYKALVDQAMSHYSLWAELGLRARTKRVMDVAAG